MAERKPTGNTLTSGCFQATRLKKSCFYETSIQLQKQRHSKALFKESPRLLINRN